MFVDRVRVCLRSGDGGAGAVSFRRQGRRPQGKPAGGSGGAGGDVIIVADPGLSTLQAYRRRTHHAAGRGVHGSGDLRHGRRGEDLLFAVPPGTAVFDEEDRLLADLPVPGQRVRALAGGRGGRGNAALVSPRRRAPAFCEQGEYGEEAWFTLEMKLLADAALIGFPNAGKSTFISRVSAARPKIADYPFTTLEPNLGVVSVGEREFTLADIPGLVEGASAGRGLGHAFLRHCERARVLVVLLDPSPLQDEGPERQYEILLGELGRHDPRLLTRPRLVLISKADLSPPGVDPLGLLPEAVREAEAETGAVSAVTGLGLERACHRIADAVDRSTREAGDGEAAREGYVLHRPVETFTVRRTEDAWVVSGRGAERAVGLNDLTLGAAASLAARRLRGLGVEEALREAGARPGDEVRIGDLTFEFSGETDE